MDAHPCGLMSTEALAVWVRPVKLAVSPSTEMVRSGPDPGLTVLASKASSDWKTP